MTRVETMERKKEHAKLLYTQQGITVQKELAERVGVSKQTINKWVNDENWEYQRASIIITKSEELKRLYNQLTELNDHIQEKPKGQRYANSKEADALVKLTAAIRQLESDTSIADAIEVLKELIHFVSLEDYDKSKEITSWADAYIKNLIK